MKRNRKTKGVPNVIIIPRPLKNGVLSYQLKYKCNGVWVKESCKDGDGNILHSVSIDTPFAREINREVQIQLQAIQARKALELSTIDERKPQINANVPLLAVADEYLRAKADYRGLVCVRNMLRNVELFDGVAVCKQINVEWCRRFQTFLIGRGLKSATIDSNISQLQSMLKWMRGKYIHYTTNPVSMMGKERVRATRGNKTFLSADEVTRVMMVDEYHETKRAFLFSCFCGLRWSDVISLRWSQISTANGTTYANVIQKKTDTPLLLPLNANAVAQMGERGSDETPVFHVTYWQMDGQLPKLCKRANIAKKVTFHTARHTFACLMLSANVNVYTIQQLMGHANIHTTLGYLAMLDSQKVNAVSTIDSLLSR